MRIWHH